MESLPYTGTVRFNGECENESERFHSAENVSSVGSIGHMLLLLLLLLLLRRFSRVRPCATP